MKRTRENWLQTQSKSISEVSGLRFFQGEDLQYQERKKAMQSTQRKWLEEQKHQNEEKKERQKQEEELHAHQTLQVNRMRGLLEDNLEAKKRHMSQSTRDFNKRMEIERKEKKYRDKQMKLDEERADLMWQNHIRQVTPYMNPLK